jgi:cell division protease FtsH
MGGREAERLLLDDLSIGASGDLYRATEIARALVEEFGLGGDEVGIGQCQTKGRPDMIQQYSHQQLEAIDRRVREILEEQRERSANILAENRPLVEALRDLLLDKKVIDAKTLGELVKKDDSENKDSDKGDAKTMSEKEEA